MRTMRPVLKTAAVRPDAHREARPYRRRPTRTPPHLFAIKERLLLVARPHFVASELLVTRAHTHSHVSVVTPQRRESGKPRVATHIKDVLARRL